MENAIWVDRYCEEEVRNRRRFDLIKVPEGAKCTNCSGDALLFWFNFCLCDICFQKLLEKISISGSGKAEKVLLPKHQHRWTFKAFGHLFSFC